MRIAVVSDTHGRHAATKQALAQIRDLAVDAILHCGDLGDPELIPLFADWPTHFVFGNVDQHRADFARAIEEAGQHCHGVFGDLQLAETRIAFLHGDDAARLRDTMAAGTWDLVCYGHTHRRETHQEGSCVVLNPGALFRARPRTFALVELPALTIEFLSVL